MTVATDGRTMAGDSLTTAQGQILAQRQKVHRLKDGRVVGASGLATECVKLVRWLNEGGDRPELSDDVVALILNPDGSASWIDNKLEELPNQQLPAAIGSGGDIAIGAMLAGAKPGDAVRLVATRQVDCGGEITVLRPKKGK